MVIGMPPAGQELIHAEPQRFVFTNLHVIGTLVGTMQDTEACLQYAKRGLLKPICEVRGRSRWHESIKQLQHGKVNGRIVIDFNKE